MLTQLGRTMVPRHDHRLGLRRMSGPRLHALLHPQSTHTFSISNSTYPSASTILPPCQTNLWCKNLIHGRCRLIPAILQTGQKIHPRGHRHIALIRTMFRQHHATSTRIPRQTTGKSNAKHPKSWSINFSTTPPHILTSSSHRVSWLL